MKKLLTLFLLCLINICAFSADCPIELTNGVDNYIKKNIESLEDESLSYEISNYSNKGELQFFDLTIKNKTTKLVYVDDLEKALDDFFKYDYFTTTKSSLKYIYDSYYLSDNLEEAKRGSVYNLVGKDEVIGTLRVEEIYPEYTELKALYISNNYTGLELRKTNNLEFNLSLYGSNSLNLGSSLTLKSTVLLYPVNPILSIRVNTDLSKVNAYFGLGAEYTLPLSYFMTGAIFSNSTLGANVILELDTFGTLNTTYDVFYKYYVSPSSSLGLSYKVINNLMPCFSLSYGMLI